MPSVKMTCRYSTQEDSNAILTETAQKCVGFMTLQGHPANNIQVTSEDVLATLRRLKTAALAEGKRTFNSAAISSTREISKAPVTYLQAAKFLIKIMKKIIKNLLRIY